MAVGSPEMVPTWLVLHGNFDELDIFKLLFSIQMFLSNIFVSE